MADLPENPNNREEEYLADIANLPNNVPDNPWSRKEAYLAAISGRLDGIDEKIAALSTDISFKGSVATETDLPSGAAVGDAYITEDTGVMYVWTGTDWVALGGTGINVVQTTGTSTTDVMSQNATASMVFNDPSTRRQVRIGGNNTYSTGSNGVAIGSVADAHGDYAVAIHGSAWGPRGIAIGNNAIDGSYAGAIALGAYSYSHAAGEMNIGSTNTSYGYNSSNYRLLTGLYDPQSAHDAATKGYVDTLVGNIETALHAINNGGNA